MKNNIIILFIVIIIITSCLPIHPPPPPVEPSLKSWNCYYGNFSNRAFHSSIHQSSSSSIYYIIGGTSDEITGLNDVWIGDISSNSLTCLTTTAGFSKRWGHTSVIFKEKIWVIGGTEDGQKGLNDVWVSENGIDWELATGSAGFSGRWGHVCRIYQTNYYDGKIWLIGGTSDGKTGLNDIWYSEDGINWTEVSISGLRFSGRWGHAITDSYSFILIGGTENGQTGLNDVWESEDGINWKLLSGNAEFEKRWGHSIVYGGKYSQYIFVANGKKNNSTYLNDIWRSKDGKNWTKIMDGNFEKRAGQSLMFFNVFSSSGKEMFRMIGGYDGANYFNQICDAEYK